MNRKILMTVGIVGVLALGALATDANAACSTTKQFGQCYFFDGSCTNLVFPAHANNLVEGGVLQGRWWQSGARANHNEGTGTNPCDAPAWIETASNDGTGEALRLYGFMNGAVYGGILCEGFGCPANDLIALVETVGVDPADNVQKAYYAVGKAPGIDEWNFAGPTGVNWVLAEHPRPRVTNSSRSGSTVNVNLSFDPPSGARGETGFAAETILTGYQLVRFEGQADPGRNPAAWTNLGAVIPVTPSGATAAGVGVVCSGVTDDVWIATRLVYDNAQFSSVYVSAPTRIECDPTLADPRFKTIDKGQSGRGTIRSNQR